MTIGFYSKIPRVTALVPVLLSFFLGAVVAVPASPDLNSFPWQITLEEDEADEEVSKRCQALSHPNPFFFEQKQALVVSHRVCLLEQAPASGFPRFLSLSLASTRAPPQA